MKVYGDVTLSEGSELKNLTVDSGTEFPEAPSIGELFFHTSLGMSCYDGSSWSSIVIDGDDRLSIAQELTVSKNPGKGQFSSIASAMDSITDSSATKPYSIFVGPGVYVEPTINFKSYVFVNGSGFDSTIIEPTSPNQHIIEGAERSAITNVTLTGATGSGYAAVHVVNTSGSSNIAFNVESCRFGSNHTLGLCEKGYLSVNGCFWGSTFGFDYGFIAKGLNDTTEARLLIRNCSSTGITTGLTGASPIVMYTVDGPLSLANLFLVFARFSGATVNNSSVGLLVRHGAKVLGFQLLIERFGKGLWVENAGNAPTIDITGCDLQHNIASLVIDHPGTLGNFSGNADRLTSSVNPSAQPTIFYNDVTSQGIVNVGPVYIGPSHSELADVSPLISRGSVLGLLEGGALTKGAGLNVNIAAGLGYARNGTTLLQVSWGSTSITAPANSSRYVYVTTAGNILTSEASPDTVSNVILGRFLSGSSSIIFVGSQGSTSIQEFNPNLDRFNKLALGPIYVSGSIVTENASTARALDVSAGHYFYSTQERFPTAQTAISFLAGYHVGGTPTLTIQAVIDNAHYDNGTDLTNLQSGYFTKHLLFITGDSANAGYALTYGTDEYATLPEAIAAPVPAPILPPDGSPAIAAIIVQQGVNSIVQILDHRPRLGFNSPSASSVTNHGDLLGLSNNDHPQYLQVNGNSVMTGDLDLGTKNLVNVGTVNGVGFESHASRHLPNGEDPFTTAAPAVAISSTSVNSAGVANSFARSDHSHAISGFQTLSNELTALAGISATGLIRRTGAGTWTAGSLVNLSSEVTGNLPTNKLNSGTGATGTTFWRGDGTWASPTITLTGDVTGAGSNSIALTLSNTGVTAGTYSNVTVDAKGRVTGGIAGAAGVINSLGYTPLNKAGDSIGGNLGFPSTSGTALTIAGEYGWKDLIGDVAGKFSGGTAPTQKLLFSTVRAWTYTAGDQGDLLFHMPHDYAPGTDLFLHFHWTHNGTNISGSFVINCFATYAKGHSQQAMIAPKTPTISLAGLNITNTPTLIHRIDEIQLSTPGGSATMLDTSQLEIDGLIMISFTTSTIPSISGSSTGVNTPFLLSADLHYQTTGLPTKNKAPNFYG